ncbi:MAG: CHAT domain-containing tetratricopeptide repeat protein [Chloracidobacterium sp.]|nr:CHAT domain-containing tetratricopeptide repeat protein [Chloracidobacterium sp.]MDW8216915.1 CHAT domain-containing tetratricopeptide repeat protein [Acidobacteriota bacterium]
MRVWSSSVVLCMTWLLLTAAARGQSAEATTPLRPGVAIEGDIGGQETRRFRLALAAGEFACVNIGQVSVKLRIAVQREREPLYDPVFGWEGKTRARPVPLFTETPAEYIITITPASVGQAGRFFVNLEVLRSATELDRRRAAAFEAFQAAQRLRRKQTKENLQAALERLQQALADYEAAKDADGTAETLVSLGLIYDGLGETQRAIACYERALPTRQALGDAYAMAQLFNNLARAYDNAGEKRRAVDYYRQAILMADAAEDLGAKATFLTNLGYTLDILGEKQEALDLLEQAVGLARQAGAADCEADALNNQGLVYESLGLPARARERIERAVSLYRQLDDRRSLAVALTNLARIYYRQRDFEKARRALEEALPLRREVGDRRGEAYTLTGLGNIAVAQNQLEDGLRRFEQALTLRRETGDRRGEGVTLASLGQTRRRMGDHRAAETAFEQALALFQAVGDRSGEATMLYRLAVARRDADDLDAARARIEQAIAVVESLRTKVAVQEFRSAYFASVKDYYDLYIDILMQLHRRRPADGLDVQALQVAERARARSLLDLLAEAGVAVRQGVDPELQARERDLLTRLVALTDRLTTLLVRNAPEEQRRALREESAAVAEALERVRRDIRTRHPRYAALTQPTPPTLAELQQRLLDPDTALLVYAVGETRSYAWVVTQTRLTSFALLSREAVNGAARLFWQVCQNPTLDPTADGEALARLVLAPLAAALDRRRVVIVPDEMLHYVPFAALPDPNRPGHRLLERHEILYTPSATALLLQRHHTVERPAPKGELAVIADPVFDVDDPRLGTRSPTPAEEAPTREIGLKVSSARLEQAAQHVGILPDNVPSATIPRLPATRLEANAIMAQLPKIKRLCVMDFDANRDTLLTGDAARYRILHIASHGLADNERPELSSILLSRFDAVGRSREGAVGLADIFNLPMAAELVVLSACRTGLGAYMRGEGLVGLTRGFMYAGASQVIVSVWSISDRATAQLMGDFYRALLKDKRPTAEALRAAQLAMLRKRRYRHPFFWAAFQLHGDWR